MAGKLFVVPTPVGNLSDMTPRAIEVLSKCDLILAEDTRTSSVIMRHFGITTPMISNHKFNEHNIIQNITNKLLSGENIALISDAGTPAISDPGFLISRECRRNNIPVETLPGATAFVPALVNSGLPCERFTFEGFLSVNKQSRFEHLQSLKQEKRTMIFYEAPHKLQNTLCDMLKYFGNREIALCRELTKIHEEVINTTFEDAIAMYEENRPIGEFVLIVSGKQDEKDVEYTLEIAIEMAQRLCESGMQMTKAAKEVAAETGFKKGDIYKGLIENQ